MQTATTFHDHYVAELSKLREDAVAFARDQPAVAHALALGHGRSSDTHIELLLQSFAYLTGRLRHQVEQDAALLPNALLGQLYPHLAAPVPSLLIAQLEVGANSGGLLPRGREFSAAAQDSKGRDVRCRLSTCFDTPLMPAEVTELSHVATTAYPALDDEPAIHSVLKLGLAGIGAEPLFLRSGDRIQCYIDIENLHAWRLYALLALQLADIAIDDGNGLKRGGRLRWLGFAEDEAALATDLVTNPGYRLLQEYFAFPEKFLFFELSGLDLSDAGARIDILFLLKSGVDRSLRFGPETIRLNCVPMINLFAQRLEPLALDQSHYEYRLSGDHANHDHTEVYRVLSLEASSPGQPARPLSPYFGFDGFAQLENQRYFYVTRRVESPLRSVPGTETYLSFLDLDLDPQRPVGDVIGGRTLCTNRRLPEQFRLGDRLRPEGPGPVRSASVIAKPTAHRSPALLGGQPWALVSQLFLNHLSLATGDQALGALKQMLRVHLGNANLFGTKQIDALSALDVRPIVRPLDIGGRRSLVEGLGIALTIDGSRFDGGSPLLFCEVLRHFFSLYASVNTLIELSLETLDVKGKVKTWPPMAGAQTAH
jgi:type VI secretion system protein ImpG